MAVSVKISQLNDGGSVNAADYLPVARGGADTFKIPASQFVIGGQNVGVGSATIFKTSSDGSGRTLQFRSLSGTDGINVVNAGDTLVVSASGQNPVKTSITGNGVTITFAINGAGSINPNNYRVDIDGVLQEPINDYNIVGSNIVFNPAPPNGSKVTVVSNNLVRAFDVVPSDGSVTTNKIALSAVTTDTLGPDIRFSIVPTGAIMPFYRSTAPAGWLICDGSAIPAQFTSLIALVGANTPNLRGMFIRGWSPGTSTTSQDPLSGSRTLGSVQNSALGTHNHTGTVDSGGSHTHLSFGGSGINGGRYGFAETGIAANNIQYVSSLDGRGSYVQTAGAHTHTFTSNNAGEIETRPVNIALLYCIKT